MSDRIKNYNFHRFEPGDDWKVWWDEPNDNHAWAFIHWCKRQMYPVRVRVNGDTLDIAIIRK